MTVGIPLRSDREEDAILQSAAFQDLSKSLDPSALERIFNDEIAPALFPAGKAANPRLEVFYGQPGSGKTTFMREAAAVAGEPTLVVNPDELKGYLPGFAAAAKISPQRARDRAQAHSADLAEKLAERALQQGAVVMVEATRPDELERYAELAERNRVPTTLNVMAVDRVTTYLRVLDRYDEALKSNTAGSCSIMTKEEHDAAYDVSASFVHQFETDNRFDRINVINPDGTKAYDNSLSGERGDPRRQWRQPARAVEALVEARNAPWSRDYSEQILTTSNGVHESRRLKKDEFGKTLPLRDYKLELRKAVYERGEFDPNDVTSGATALNAERYLIRVKEELLYSMKASREADAARRDDFARRINDFDRLIEARVDGALERAGVEKDPLGSRASRGRKRAGRTVYLNSEEAAAMERLIAGAAARGDVRDGRSGRPTKRQRSSSVDSGYGADLELDAAAPNIAENRAGAGTAIEASAQNSPPDREEDPTRSPGDVVDAVGDAFEEEGRRRGRDAATRRGLDSNGRDGRSL